MFLIEVDAETMALLYNVTDVKSVQSKKARSPMLVTLLGIVTEVRPMHLSKALYPILVTKPIVI